MKPGTIISPEVFSTLPKKHRYSGAASKWAEMTRPGRSIHSFLESPFFDAQGNLWLSDVAVGRIFRVTPDGTWSLEHDYDGAPHAMRHLSDGRVLVADYYRGLGLLTDGRFSPLSGGSKEMPFLGLSDMTVGSDGMVWITDSGRSSLTEPCGRLWRLDPSGELQLVLSNVPYSNGVALSPDGSQVYVAATRANQIWRLSADIPRAGTPMAGVFLNLSGGLGPDGLATNTLGWLAIAQAQAGRAYVTDAFGDPVAEIRLPNGLWTTSVVFAPDNPRRIFIVEAEHGTIFAADLPCEKDTS